MIFSVDAETLAVSSTLIAGVREGDFIESLAVDARSGKLYAATDDFTHTGSQVLEIDPLTGVATPVATFPGFSLTSLTFDSSTGGLYGIAETFPLLEPNRPAVARVDLQSGRLTTLYQATSPYAFFDLAVIPGTLFFYTRATGGYDFTFALLDAVAGTLTPLGISNSTINQLTSQNFSFAPRPVPVGNLSYTIEDVCFPASCLADVLNDRGTVAGSATGAGLENSIFIKSSGSGIRYVTGAGKRTVPMSTNNRGDIVGYTYVEYSYEPTAFLYAASSDQFYKLDMFEGQYGEADYINNRGQITGNFKYFNQDAFGAKWLSGLTDSGILLGLTKNGLGFVRGPFGTEYTENAYALVFNNLGQFLSYRYGGLTGNTVVYTPGTPLRVLPGNTGQFGFPVGLSDAGLGFSGASKAPERGSSTSADRFRSSVPRL